MSEFADDVEGSAAHYDDVDAGEEFVVAVRNLLAREKEVEGVVGASKKTIEADSAKDGEFNGGLLDWRQCSDRE